MDVLLPSPSTSPASPPATFGRHPIDQERQVLSELASGSNVGDVLEGLLRDVEERAGGAFLTSVLFVGEDGLHLLHAAAPSLPAAYCEAIHGIPVGDGVGSCGTATARGEPVYVSDIATDPLWADFRELAAEHGLHACWSTPIRAVSGAILGPFAVYYREAREPTPADIAAIDEVARTVALAIERHLLDRGFARLRSEGETLLRLGDALRDAQSIHEITARAGEVIGQGMDADRAMYGELSRDGARLTVTADWHGPGLVSIAGVYTFAAYGDFAPQMLQGEPLIIGDVAGDPRTAALTKAWYAMGTRAIVNMPVTERGEVVGVLSVHSGRPRVWLASEITLIRSAADRITAAIARQRAEDQQEIVNGEIAHRLKNTLAMVQSVAMQTLGAYVPPDVLDAYARRLQAIGTAHDALTVGKRLAASVGGIVAGVLEAASVEERCVADGPEVTAGSGVALSLSMILHELTTNAVKYGALSVPTGHVVVSWRVEGDGDDPEFMLDWRELGGPPPSEPGRKGFGSKLLKYGLSGTGSSAVRYERTGLEASFRSPLSRVEAP